MLGVFLETHTGPSGRGRVVLHPEPGLTPHHVYKVTESSRTDSFHSNCARETGPDYGTAGESRFLGTTSAAKGREDHGAHAPAG